MTRLQVVPLELSELEAMRLCDLEGLHQHAAGERMGVSRGTVQRLLQAGRAKAVEALVRNRALVIAEGAPHEQVTPEPTGSLRRRLHRAGRRPSFRGGAA